MCMNRCIIMCTTIIIRVGAQVTREEFEEACQETPGRKEAAGDMM